MKLKNLILFILLFFIINIYSLDSSDLNKVDLKKVNDLIWIHTSYENINGYLIPSNGLILISVKGIILIDTPWNNNQTKELLIIIKNKFNRNIISAIFTHFHKDRVGGIEILHENNIETKSTELTANLMKKIGYQKPKSRLYNDITLFNYGDIKFESYFPGAGHTLDNIIMWFPEYKILFGGCFLKAEDSKNLGNISDSDIKQWSKSINNIKEKYNNVNIFIPGHGNWSKNDLLSHTLDLLNNNK